MSVNELEEAVKHLTPEQLAEFRAWFIEYDWEMWDRQIEDSEAGLLDELATEAFAEFEAGRCLPLPGEADIEEPGEDHAHRDSKKPGNAA